MNHVVLIAFRGGGTVLPYRTPYDRELVFDHVAQCAKRYGDVQMELGSHHWTVSANGNVGVACSGCGQTHAVSYANGPYVLCHPCARRQLGTGRWTLADVGERSDMPRTVSIGSGPATPWDEQRRRVSANGDHNTADARR
jgi:hypothetical protein